MSPAEVLGGLDAVAGHTLLPVGGAGADHGGHKGFGLSLLVELRCGVPLSRPVVRDLRHLADSLNIPCTPWISADPAADPVRESP